MNVKTMDGLIGAGVNLNLMDVPIRVYKEARLKGDLATMERAMGYAGDFADKAYEYKAKADEGMKEEAREEREKAKEELAKSIEERREERKAEKEALEERNEEKGSGDVADEKTTETGKAEAAKTEAVKTEAVKTDRPALYTSTGAAQKPEEQDLGLSVSIRA